MFAPEFKAFLQRACDIGRRRRDLADAVIKTYARTLARELDRRKFRSLTLLVGSTSRRVRKRSSLGIDDDGVSKMAAFGVGRLELEQTSVIFRKVTNCFGSDWGAKVYAISVPLLEPAASTARAPSPPSAPHLVEQNKTLLARIDELLARIAELEGRAGKPPKTPANSSLPPSSGQKANVADASTTKKGRRGHPG